MTHLEQLLVRLRDGETLSSADFERAVALLRADERIPEELRSIALTDPHEAATDAAGLLALLGADDLGEMLAEAIHAEAGALGATLGAALGAPDAEPELSLDLGDVALDDWAPIGSALAGGLRAEADGFEIAHAVMRRLPLADFAWGPVLADAVAEEAGGVDVAGGVLAALDRPAVPVAEAVLAEAGDVELAADVMAALGLGQRLGGFELGEVLRVELRAEAGAVDVADAVMSLVAPPRRSELRSANDYRTWSFAGLALAAAALATFVVGRLAVPVDAGPIGSGQGGFGEPQPALQFAQAGDVVIEDLSYGEDVVVFQTEGDQGAVILWFDEEA